jgi:hypothetical protein
MKPLHCHAPRGGYNNTNAAVALRVLDHPEHMNMVDLLVRELVQNSLDAKAEPQSGTVHVNFDVFEPTAEVGQAWKESLGTEGIGQWVTQFVDDDWCMLRVTDQGTTGLNGPVDPYSASPVETPARFQRVAFAFGKPDSSNSMGIGSWGLGGKTVVLRMAASLGVVAYYSRPQNNEASRFIGIHCFDHVSAKTESIDPFAGFAWWGAESEKGEVDGVVGDEADRYAQALGCDTTSDFHGTQILIPLPLKALQSILPPTIGGQNELKHQMNRLCTEIHQAAQCWWWPRLSGRVDSTGERARSDLKICTAIGHRSLSDENGQDYVRPRNHQFYSQFARLYHETFKQECEKLIGKRYGQYQLGSICREMLDPDEQDDDLVRDEWNRMGVSDGSWSIAQIRNSGLVVSYFPDSKMSPQQRASGLSLRCSSPGIPVAVFRVNGLCEVKKSGDSDSGMIKLEEVFRAAENSAHSEWSYNLVSDRRQELGDWARQYISQTYSGLKELFTENKKEAPRTVVDAKDLEALAKVSHELGRLLPIDGAGAPDGLPPMPPLTPPTKPGEKPAGGGAGVGNREAPPPPPTPMARGKVRLVDLQPTGTDGEFEATLVLRGTNGCDIELCVLDARGKAIDFAGWKDYSKDEPYPLCVGQGGGNRLLVEPGRHTTILRIDGEWLIGVKNLRA